MSAFGVQPFYPGPHTRPGVVMTLIQVVPVRLNEAIAFFDDVPKAHDPIAFDSATNPSNWTLSTVDRSVESTTVPGLVYRPIGDSKPTYEPTIARVTVDDGDPTQLHVFTDEPFEQGVIYDVNLASRVRAVGCVPYDTGYPARFRALRKGPERRSRLLQLDPYRDIENLYYHGEDGQGASTWNLRGNGDFAIGESLRKRIYRRIFTRPGGFAHLGEEYGIGVNAKAIARTSDIQAMANRVAEQVRQEPDVSTCAVTISVLTTGLVRILVAIVRTDRVEYRFLFDLPSA